MVRNPIPDYIKRTVNLVGRSRDNFDNLLTLSTNNEADIAAHFPFNAERWRLYKNGVRQFQQYGSVSGFTDEDDQFTVSPAGGESWKVETAELFSYKVGYVIEPSAALSVNQELQGNDVVTLSYGDADLENVDAGTTDLTTGSPDGWVLKFTADATEFNIYRSGSLMASETIRPENDLTEFSRFAFKLNWYNVGNAELIESFVDGNKQENPILGEVGVENGKGPTEGNKNVQFAVRPDANTSNLELNTGSVGVRTLGDVDELVREKAVYKAQVTVGQADTWEPIYAIKVADSGKELVKCELINLEILKYSATDDVEIIAVSVDSSKTDASGFVTPDEHFDPNSAIKETENVTTVPNESGVETDPGIDFSPGGFNVGQSVLTTSKGSSVGGFIGGTVQKSPVYNDDVVVFLARSSSTGDVNFRYSVEQNW